MKKTFLFLTLSFLIGCGTTIEDGYNNDLYGYENNKKPYIAYVNAESYWYGNRIYGLGNTKEEAVSEATSRCRVANNNESLKYNPKKEFSCNLITVDLKPHYKEKIQQQQILKAEQQKIFKSNIDDNMEMYKSKCVEIGFALKTKEHANCVLELMKMQSNNQAVSGSNDALINEMRAQEKRQRNQQTSDELLGLSQELLKGKSLGEIYGGATPKSGGGSGSCTLTNSVQSGTNRICYYRCGVSTQTSNVGAAQQCPITM